MDEGGSSLKKLLSLVLVVGMLLAMASFAFAGTITWGGNLRVWYIDSQGPTNSESTFQFDRVALTFKDAFSDHDGVSAEFQWRNFAGNDTAWDSTASKNVGTKQARLDSGYYYYDGLLGQGDEFRVGVVANLPFRLGLSKNAGFVDTGLGSKLKVGNTVGIWYEMDAARYTVGLGVVNANEKDINNSAENKEGMSYSVRLDAGKNFFGVIPGLRLGGGYNHKQTGMHDNYTTNKVIDIAYVKDAFWVSAEKGYSTPTANGIDAACQTGMYFEAGINVGKSKIWAGRLIQDAKNPLNDVIYKDSLAQGNMITGIKNGNIVAAIIPILATSDLQFQYIVGDQDTGKEFDLRYQVKF